MAIKSLEYEQQQMRLRNQGISEYVKEALKGVSKRKKKIHKQQAVKVSRRRDQTCERIIAAYAENPSITLKEVGKQLGVSKERVRQIIEAYPRVKEVTTLLKQAAALDTTRSLRLTPKTVDETGERTPEYAAFSAMIQRCYNPNNPNYARYGAVGVAVFDDWNPAVVGPSNAWENFYRAMGPRPKDLYPNGRAVYSLDRIDNVPLYSPLTCRWATQKEQCSEGQRGGRFEQ